jgi:catechol 2,3-dioxygenase-like lactoylglutathione lyase family enzyme
MRSFRSSNEEMVLASNLRKGHPVVLEANPTHPATCRSVSEQGSSCGFGNCRAELKGESKEWRVQVIKALSEIEVITLFVENLKSAKEFYQHVFGLAVVFQDDVSVVMKLKNLMINLLQVSAAHELIEPAAVAGPEVGSRLLLTIKVEDANAVCAELERHGVKLLNGPVDRPWGRRTAAFADPAGNVWEIAQELEKFEPDAD